MARLPLWFKIAYSCLVAVVVPSYLVLMEPTHLLWLSDVALIMLLPAVWCESTTLASMVSVMVLPLELVWNLGFFARLLLGIDLFGIAGYVFETDTVWGLMAGCCRRPSTLLCLWS